MTDSLLDTLFYSTRLISRGTSSALNAMAGPYTVSGFGQGVKVFTAAIPTLFRGGMGAFVAGHKFRVEPDKPGEQKIKVGSRLGYRLIEETSLIQNLPRPAKPLELYEFNLCPYCKKVREVLNYLDLDVIVHPCPKNGPHFREQVRSEAGKTQFPYLVDPNTGVKMFESQAIIEYLFETYGKGAPVPLIYRVWGADRITAPLAALPRMGKGMTYAKSKADENTKPIELWGYEGSPFVQLVRERLTELEVPHLWHVVARGSPKRGELLRQKGRFQVPFIRDPNTGEEMFESEEIIKYLDRTYALPA